MPGIPKSRPIFAPIENELNRCSLTAENRVQVTIGVPIEPVRGLRSVAIVATQTNPAFPP